MSTTTQSPTLPSIWAEVCKIQGIDPEFTPSLEGVEEEMKPGIIAAWKLFNIGQALNGKDWKPDYSDVNEYKHFPWFYFDPSLRRFRFRSTHYGYTTARAGTGARLVFKSSALAQHAGTAFEDIYNELLLAPGTESDQETGEQEKK